MTVQGFEEVIVLPFSKSSVFGSHDVSSWQFSVYGCENATPQPLHYEIFGDVPLSLPSTSLIANGTVLTC